MSNRYPISNKSDYEIIIIAPLSDYERKILLNLYMPIVGDKVISLYQTMHTLVNEGSFESDIEKHEKIVKLMHLRSMERFIDLRCKLEAIGLLDVYYKDSLYIYILKRPKDATQFFNDENLATLLEYQIGKEEYLKAYTNYVMKKLDINKFENITHNFDAIYDIAYEEDILLSQATFNNINNGIIVNNQTFDFERFSILLAAHDVIKTEYFADEEFINNVKRYSFLYCLNPEELKDVVIMSCNEYKEINYLEMSKNAKKVYANKGKKLAVVPKQKVNKVSNSDNKLVKFLETASPSEFVRHKSGTALTASEIEMFDQLLKDTNINIGVLNVLLGYVLENLNGEIPGYNYFLKIINTWKRAKVKSTMDAMDYINNRGKTQKNYNKKEKELPSWYNDYVEELNNNHSDKNKDVEGLDDLKQFFKPLDKGEKYGN